ncbi:axial regulator YABBY2 isoform X1 [Zea mays]|uniref:Axial regulator YABBY2 n=1 Tax=Zea mays TaxID=4577 RepID=A0A1D6IHD6_MAIZE|eukprot:XP_008651472.1 axial regulator YABBY2 isoform X1 [Zea mays]
MSSSSSPRHPCFGAALPERLGYVQCKFCATILLVGVPIGGSLQLLKTVAVQCGSCCGILSVALPPDEAPAPASVELLPLMQEAGGVDPPPRDSDESSGEDRGETTEAATVADNHAAFPAVNKPPLRKQRTPSAYNCFIKEEIQRIKARDPGITHKEAFSAASKNWAHLPRIQKTGG